MKRLIKFILTLSAIAAVMSCANVGMPTGGPYDETPPRFLKSTPVMGEKNVKKNKITIQFDEYLKLNNPSENIVISPPQTKSPDIKAVGKNIQVTLADTLIPDKTYTIDETSVELVHKIPELLEQAVRSVKNAEFARVHFSAFNTSSLDFELVYFIETNDYTEYTRGVQAVNFAILDIFAKEGINFAYPAQRMISQ